AFAALYYVKNGITPSHTIKLLFVADEENGSEYGIIYLMKNFNLFKKTDLILIPDGGDPKGETIEIAEKNILWLNIHVIGKQTHGSRPDSGANACLAACDLSVRLHKLEEVFNKKDPLFEPDYSTFQPTKREKNVDSINIIPGEDRFCMDCRILPCYSLSSVLEKVDQVCAAVIKEYGVKIEYTAPQKSESPATDHNAPVVKKLAAALKTVHGIDAKCIGIGGGTVGAELRREGIPAVVWSTLDDQAHQPNEYCKVENLIKDALTLIEFFK
nr:M20 family metallo-hydrolase [Treponema sp.]